MEFRHYSVLLRETIEQLHIKPDGIYVDGTLGGGGHALEVCSRLRGGHLYGIDQDGEAIAAAKERLAAFGDRATLLRDNYCNMRAALSAEGVKGVDGIVIDLGVSSYQFDNQERGFSYRFDAALDMRMDREEGLTAAEIVNGWPQEELRRILFEYGEERYAPQIARAVVRAREDKPVGTTGELAELIRSAMPSKALREKQHPAKRSFQAIRIAVNGELDALPPMLDAAAEALLPGGRLAVITFHSLEDRIVKQRLRELATGCTCPPEFPVCVCGKKPKLRLVNRKPVVSGPAELAENPRARSAKLRAAERTEF